MAQYDIYLQQNNSDSGVEWVEKITAIAPYNLLGTGSDNYVKAFGFSNSGGIAIDTSNNTIVIAFDNMTAETTVASNDEIIINDVSVGGGALRKMTRSDFLSGISDSFKVKVATDGTEDFLGETASTGILRTSAPLVYEMDGFKNFITLSISDGTALAKGVLQVGTNLSVASGVVSVATATTAVKGVASFSSSDFGVSSGAVSLAADVMRRVTAPAAWNSPGSVGQFAIDSNYFYFAIDNASWRRTAGAKWS